MTGVIAFQKASSGGGINHDSRQVFLSLYPNRHQSILKPHGCKSWVTMSRHAPLADQTIWEAIGLQADTIWGCRWGNQTRFAVLDIDETSQYHNELGLARVRHLLASVGLRSPQIYQSSDSQGWHLYLSFSSWVDCQALHNALKQWLLAEGLKIKSGQLELFPSNNGLRLPLQRGFAWLDDQGAITLRREEIAAEEAIFRFVAAQDANAHDWAQVQNRIASRLTQIEASASPALPAREIKNKDLEEDGFSALFSGAGKIEEVYNAGRAYWQNGLSASGQRHHAILCIGHYLWYGDEGEGVRALPGVARSEQRATVIEAWLQEKHNGYSKSVLRGDWKEIGADIRRACNWTAPEGTERHQESYPLSDRAIDRLTELSQKTGRVWYPEDFQKGNVGREEAARNKIQSALVQLVDSGRRVTLRALMRLSGCDHKTINKHIDIWGVFRLPRVGGDLSLLGGGVVGPVPCSVPVFDNCADLDLSSSSGLKSPVLVDSLCSEVSPDLGCLTPYAKTLRGDGEQLNGKSNLRFLPPPLTASLATGSSIGALTCKLELGSTCGLNGFPPTLRVGPSHLNPREVFYMALCARSWRRSGGIEEPIFYKGARVLNLTARGWGWCFGRAPPEMVL